MAVGLSSLEIEILALILEFVVAASPKTTKSISLVNKHFYSATTLIGHRSKTICYHGNTKGANGKLTALKPWIENAELLRGVRYLSVEESFRPQYAPQLDEQDEQDRETAEKGKYDDLTELIARLGNLKKLNWLSSDQIPVAVLKALHKHRGAELAIWNWHRRDTTARHDDEAEIALASSPALTSIRAQIWKYGAENYPDLRETAFKRIVANAPNLRHASVVTGHSGCVVSFMSLDQIQEVHEMSKLFYTHTKPNDSLRSLTLDGYGLTEHTLRTWSKFVDLSKLTSIKCSRGNPDISYFSYAPAVLTSLRHVSLNLSHHDDAMKHAVEGYITNCAPLESLSLWSWHGVISLSSILDVHGPTLKTLDLHERETANHDGQSPRRLLTAEEVTLIKMACPNLRKFTFDIDRHTRDLESELEEDAEIFAVVTDMSLDKLQIYYDLGIARLNRPYGAINRPMNSLYESDHDDDSDGGDQGLASGDSQNKLKSRERPGEAPEPLDPTPNSHISTYAKKLWSTVFGGRRGGARTLELKFGEWESKMGTGYPAPWVMQEQNLKTRWVIRPMERDDQQSECEIRQHGTGYTGDTYPPEVDPDL